MNYLSLFEEHTGWLFDEKRTFLKKNPEILYCRQGVLARYIFHPSKHAN